MHEHYLSWPTQVSENVPMKIPEEWRDIARKRLFYGIAAVIGLVSFVAFLAIGGSMRDRLVFALLVGIALTASALSSLGHKRLAVTIAATVLILALISR